ncbi:MAG: FtsW/RodA/SpoVE family cell cycle protein [Bacteroidales bacterium]
MEGKGIFKYLHGDKGIWYIVLILSFISVLAVYSSTGLLAYRYQGGHTGYYVLKHAMILMCGWAVMYMAHRVKYTYYSRISQLLFIISIPLLVVTLFMGSVNDASRWITIPIIGFSFQTSDLAKLALVMFLARQLSKHQKDIKENRTFYSIVYAPLLICLLIFPENLSTAAILMITSLVMMVVGGIRSRYLVGLMGVGFLSVGFLVASFYLIPESKLPGRFATWKNRIENFKTADPEMNYQATQAKIAVAGGGIIGKFPGNSTQRNFLPHPYSDYIYAIIIEEYGLLGGICVLFLYLWLFRRGIIIARKCEGSFGCFLVIGICFLLTLQAMINMGVAVNLLPVTGQPLPFLSMGGTSLWFTALGVGIVLSVSVAVDKQGEGKNIDSLQEDDGKLLTAVSANK